ncbi:hypothetical protein SRABI70_01956 [Pseudomonas sp. Bi70]|uniref:hypothetical protein n=1 Tax=Pseudomonas sp. Bi70 TaxID=2821127 RepID=UPI001D98669E|nr:hypothetical protein [Pseudomonas sp. Bi70]CAH0209680.1 hypothetical protein SRABI70_01956 [Pseudomonas sp. Bi70]
MRLLLLFSLLMAVVACKQADHGDIAHPDDIAARFYSGCAKPGEFLDLADLPAIPASFDEGVR